MNQEKVGKFIKEIRVKNNLTQKEFADKFGVTYQAVSKWENGKNLPDINILKEMCNLYNVSLDEILNSTEEEKKNIRDNKKFFLFGTIVLVSMICCIGGLLFLFKDNENDFQFKTLSSTCDKFRVSGSIAYNDSKSSIYISHVDYCGGDDTILYKNLRCVLYEVVDDVKKEVSKYNYVGEVGMTLEEFLSDVSFNVDNYDRVCDEYQENSFILEVDVINDESEMFTYKIPLILEDNCST